MIQEFEGLNQEEQQLLVDSIPLITILIAGADGNIDQDELDWSEKLTGIRAYAHPDTLNPYYELVGQHFSERMTHLMTSLPQDTATRQEAVSQQLAQLNAVLPKLEFNYAQRLYTSLTSFAEHVAKASGGFLGFASISKEEASLLDLPMITPILG